MGKVKERKTSHEALVEQVEEAIDAVFSDTSVSQSQTREDLRDIISNCEIRIRSMGKVLE